VSPSATYASASRRWFSGSSGYSFASPSSRSIPSSELPWESRACGSHHVERPQKPSGRTVPELRIARTALHRAALDIRHEPCGAQTFLLNQPARDGRTRIEYPRTAVVVAAPDTCACEPTIRGRVSSFIDQSLGGVADREGIAVSRDEGGSDRRRRPRRGASEGDQRCQRAGEEFPVLGHGPYAATTAA